MFIISHHDIQIIITPGSNDVQYHFQGNNINFVMCYVNHLCSGYVFTRVNNTNNQAIF